MAKPKGAQYEVQPKELAAWLRAQRESWWTVDGEADLMAEVSFPCPSENLASAFSTRSIPLLVTDPESRFGAETRAIGSKELDQIAASDSEEDRTLELRWKEGVTRAWLLLEDSMAAELNGAPAKAERK